MYPRYRIMQTSNNKKRVKVKPLPENINDLPVHTCVFVPEYKFKVCEITTCKNYSAVTPCCCLAIDRAKTQGTKFISDAELHLFKYSAKKVTTRFVAMKRKKAVDRVKNILILKKLIDYIRDMYEAQGESSPFIKGKYAQKAQTIYPLYIEKLGFKNWMFHYLIDEEVQKEFIESNTGGECKKLEINKILNLSDFVYNKILKEIAESKKQS
jgi:hypothetical protein